MDRVVSSPAEVVSSPASFPRLAWYDIMGDDVIKGAISITKPHSVECTMYFILCALHIVLCTIYRILCRMYRSQGVVEP